MQAQDGAWILAFIGMVGAVFAGLFKLISKNGCRVKCNWPNGNLCCDTDCDQGREILVDPEIATNPTEVTSGKPEFCHCWPMPKDRKQVRKIATNVVVMDISTDL